MPPLTPKQELEKILSTTDASDIEKIQFFPSGQSEFGSTNEKIKKLVLYISNSLGKTLFEPGELKKAFGFIVSNLDSQLSTKEYREIHDKIFDFITLGGHIEIVKKGANTSKLFPNLDTKKTVAGNGGNNMTEERKTHEDTLSHISVHSHSTDIIPEIEFHDKPITKRDILLAIFFLGPISAIIGSLLLYPLQLIFFAVNNGNISYALQYPMFVFLGNSSISLIACSIIFILISKKILHISTRKSVKLLVISFLIFFGVFIAVCGGIILLLSQ